MTKPPAVLETSLYASDLDAAEHFYGDVVGLELESKVAGRHLFFYCGPGMLLVFDPASTAHGGGPVPAHGATGPGHVAFAVEEDELPDWAERLRAAGIAIEADVEWPGGARSLYVRDPAGNSVEFAPRRIWGLI